MFSGKRIAEAAGSSRLLGELGGAIAGRELPRERRARLDDFLLCSLFASFFSKLTYREEVNESQRLECKLAGRAEEEPARARRRCCATRDLPLKQL